MFRRLSVRSFTAPNGAGASPQPTGGVIEILLVAFGAGLAGCMYIAVERWGATIAVGSVLAVFAFGVTVAAFYRVPHIAVATLIPLFVLVPMTKVLFVPWIGPIKDAAVLAAVLAVAIRLARLRAVPDAFDRWTIALAAVLFGLYFVNIGGSFGTAWLQGVRLVSEPLLCLLIGLGLDQPRRTLAWAVRSLIATACAVALVGLGQQLLGQWELVKLGYSFDLQVRTIGGHLRSFGTLDDPFSYAAFLFVGLAAVLTWMRRGLVAYVVGGVVVLGIMFALVRTAPVVFIALSALWLARKGHARWAGLVAGGAIVFASALLLSGSFSLNGRAHAWRTALGQPSDWILGRGVGTVGTAAERATFTLTQTSDEARKHMGDAVDSGYLATIADVGLVGLLVRLTLFSWLLVLAARHRGHLAGWFAFALLTVLLLDALTRDSFTSFPAAYLGLLLVGLALSAAHSHERPDP